MESSIAASQTGGISKPKPALAPKPRLTPKPFSLQKNTSIRSIHAPTAITSPSKTAAPQTGKSDATGVPKLTLPTPAQKPTTSGSKPSSVRVVSKDQPKAAKESKASPHGDDTLDSAVGKSNPAPQTVPPKKTPKSEPIQKDDIIQTNHKASTDSVTNSEQKDRNKKEDETQTSVVQKREESGSDASSTANPTNRRCGTRKRLSAELTSKFESGGLSLPPQPTISISTTGTKNDVKKPDSLDSEQNQTTSEPSNRGSDEGGLTEDYAGGGSIKRRISLLFDSSSRPEVITKREEPEIINSTGGVKERIKNWTTETSSEGPRTEKKPQVIPRTRSKSFEPATAPTAEKISKKPPVEPPTTETSSSHAVSLPSKVSPAEQPTETLMETSKDALIDYKSSESSRETSGEHVQDKSTEGEVQLRHRIPSTSHTTTDEGDSATDESTQHAPKRDNVKRRSVRFGVVERDDGGPPVILGSGSDSSEEEGENAPEDEAEEQVPVSVPVYRRIGVLQKKDDEVQKQEAEQLKHLEFEKKRRAEETEQVKLKLEEERKRKEEEEEEKEKEKARQREEEERERERLKEEEKERQRKEEWEIERLKEEERERERLREEEEERERQMELMWQRQREEERERERERLKHDQEERENERLKEEEREEERLREERERQRLKEEQERLIHEHDEHKLEAKLRTKELNKEKQREEEWEKEWVNKTRSLGGEVEEEDELEREEEMELMRHRQKEERLRQEESIKEKIREETEERERHRRQKEQQEKEEVMEGMRQIEMEKQREEERREEERKRQIEKERVEELERKMQEELERKRAQELEEKLRIEKEKERDGLTSRDRERAVDVAEPKLISFDSEDVPQAAISPYSPLAKASAPTDSQLEVVYDDFSVRSPFAVDFDDFSVKPKRWGSQAKTESSPPFERWAPDPVDKQEVEVPMLLDVNPWEKRELEWVEPSPAQESPEEEEEEEQRTEEEQLIWRRREEEEKEEQIAEEEQLIWRRREEEETKEDEVEEEDNMQEAHINSFSTNGEGKDTDALIDNEPLRQNEACEQTAESDSPKPGPDQVPEASSENVDTTDFHREPELAPFPESSAPLLDTSAQRSKADLGKRRIRARPSRSLRAGLAPTKSPDWRTCDSTDEKEATLKQRESDSEEEQPKPKIVCSPPPTSQRVPIFPGLSPAALLAQIKKKTGGGATGGGEETEEDKGREEKGSQNEEAALSPSQLSRSPRSASFLAGAARVLPPLGGTDGGAAASSPAWLKELKSKKRLSQYDSEA